MTNCHPGSLSIETRFYFAMSSEYAWIFASLKKIYVWKLQSNQCNRYAIRRRDSTQWEVRWKLLINEDKIEYVSVTSFEIRTYELLKVKYRKSFNTVHVRFLMQKCKWPTLKGFALHPRELILYSKIRTYYMTIKWNFSIS